VDEQSSFSFHADFKIYQHGVFIFNTQSKTLHFCIIDKYLDKFMDYMCSWKHPTRLFDHWTW